MKPFEKFIVHMRESARLFQTNDTGAATEVIQKALREAGLLGDGAQAPGADAPSFVDLNAPPAWSRPSPGRAKPGRTNPGVPTPGVATPGVATPDPAAPGSFTDGNFTCAAGTRRYKLYVPTAPQASAPLVVMLHGCTQHPADFATGTAMNAVAERHGCFVLYPEQDRAANHNVCWNWFDRGHQARDAGEPAILAGMTRDVVARHGVDPSRVFVAGLSAGGAMAAVLGATYPDLYAAVGVHSGLAAGCAKDMMSGLKAMRQPGRAARLQEGVPIIVFHGDGDQLVHPANGEAVLRQYLGAHEGPGSAAPRSHSERRDVAGRKVTRTTWRHARGGKCAEHWVLHGAAHAWSGGNAAGSHTDTLGPSASEEMLRFFLE